MSSCFPLRFGLSARGLRIRVRRFPGPSWLSDDPTRDGIGRGPLVLAALWWAWTGYAWLTNTLEPEEGPVRAGMFAAMAAMLVVALTVPGAFDAEAAGTRDRSMGNPQGHARPWTRPRRRRIQALGTQLAYQTGTAVQRPGAFPRAPATCQRLGDAASSLDKTLSHIRADRRVGGCPFLDL